MILPIRAYGDPVLKKPSNPVGENTSEIQELIDNMIQTMKAADGAGLAAPQIGKSIRIFVADLTAALDSIPEDDRVAIPQQPMVCINPEIIFKSEEKEEFEEGCLSIPNLPVKVQRSYRVKLRYLDRSFNTHEIEGFGPLASVLQHENDHLDGILHIDYLTAFKKRLIKNRLAEIKAGEFGVNYKMTIGLEPL